MSLLVHGLRQPCRPYSLLQSQKRPCSRAGDMLLQVLRKRPHSGLLNMLLEIDEQLLFWVPWRGIVMLTRVCQALPANTAAFFHLSWSVNSRSFCLAVLSWGNFGRPKKDQCLQSDSFFSLGNRRLAAFKIFQALSAHEVVKVPCQIWHKENKDKRQHYKGARTTTKELSFGILAKW
eukprot:g1449.t1